MLLVAFVCASLTVHPVVAEDLPYGPFDLSTAYGRYAQEIEDFRIGANKLPIGDTQAYYDYFEQHYPDQLAKYDAAIAELEASSYDSDHQLAAAIKNTREKLIAYHEAIVAKDENTIRKTGDELSRTANSEVELANRITSDISQKAAEEDTFLLWLYGGLTGLFGTFTLGTLWWARRSRPLVTGSKYDRKADQLMREHRMALVYSTLWGLAGSVVTLVWYLSIRDSGGTYMIFYGPMVFGGIMFIKGMIDYKRKSRSQGFIEEVKTQDELVRADGSLTIDGYMMEWRRLFQKAAPAHMVVPATLSVDTANSLVRLQPKSREGIDFVHKDMRMLGDGNSRLIFTTKQKKSYVFSLRQDNVKVGFWQSLRRELSWNYLSAKERSTHAIVSRAVSNALNMTFNRIKW